MSTHTHNVPFVILISVVGLRVAFDSDGVGTGFNVASMLLGCTAGAVHCGQSGRPVRPAEHTRPGFGFPGALLFIPESLRSLWLPGAGSRPQGIGETLGIGGGGQGAGDLRLVGVRPPRPETARPRRRVGQSKTHCVGRIALAVFQQLVGINVLSGGVSIAAGTRGHARLSGHARQPVVIRGR